jgi:hypothetical protein
MTDRRIVEDFSCTHPQLKEIREVVLAMLEDEDRLKKSGKQIWLQYKCHSQEF